jgi:hypothetical protein
MKQEHGGFEMNTIEVCQKTCRIYEITKSISNDCITKWRYHYLDYIASNGRMINELKRIWKEAVVAKSRYCPSIHLEGQENYEKPPGHPLSRPRIEQHMRSASLERYRYANLPGNGCKAQYEINFFNNRI